MGCLLRSYPPPVAQNSPGVSTDYRRAISTNWVHTPDSRSGWQPADARTLPAFAEKLSDDARGRPWIDITRDDNVGPPPGLATIPVDPCPTSAYRAKGGPRFPRPPPAADTQGAQRWHDTTMTPICTAGGCGSPALAARPAVCCCCCSARGGFSSRWSGRTCTSVTPPTPRSISPLAGSGSNCCPARSPSSVGCCCSSPRTDS